MIVLAWASAEAKRRTRLAMVDFAKCREVGRRRMSQSPKERAAQAQAAWAPGEAEQLQP
jgi:hypothetical protein